MSSEVAELCEFLEHERADVRQMAAEGVKTYTGSGDGLTLLLQVEGLLCRLVSMLGDVSSAATAAAVGAALVNISQEPAARAKLLNLSCVDAATPSAAAAAASLQSTSQSTPQPAAVTSASGSKATGASEARSESKRAEEELLEMCLLLLANLTQFDRGCAQLLGETSRPHLCRLLASFAAAPAHTAYFDSFPLVLTHVCAASDGRAMLLLEHPSALRLLSKLALTADSKPLHAVAQSLRNLCFEAAETAPNASALRELADGIIVSLTVRLTPPDAELDDEEIAMLSPMMREALEVVESAVPREETERGVRLLLTEALLLLTASRALRKRMRAAGVFVILRASLAAEEPFDVDPNNPVRDANEKLGGLLVATQEEDEKEDEGATAGGGGGDVDEEPRIVELPNGDANASAAA